jgi:ABC-type antimicrobial peptide transport system permease subunit
MDRIDLLDGYWPKERALAPERQSPRYFGIPLGTHVIVEIGRREQRLPIGGIVHVSTVYPPQFGGDATFYATPETVAWLTGLDAFSLLKVRLESFSEEGADEVAQQIERRLERMGLLAERDCFVPFDVLGQETGTVDRGTIVMALSEKHGAESEQALMRDLRDAYTVHGIKPAFLASATEMREQNRRQFNIITYLMLAMAILTAIVGGIGLMGTMSINVVERSREIGVMRAIGATSPTIVGIFVSEGVLSWLLAVPLSYPGARLFSDVVGDTLREVPLDFSYSMGGMVLWLAVVVVLSALTSLWPALRATKVSVRQALAYE